MSSLNAHPPEVHELEEILEYRKSQHLLIASVFQKEPTRDQLEAYLDMGVRHAKQAPSSVPERALLNHLARYAGDDMDTLLTKVRTEYAELFIGPRPPLAPLFESLYVGQPRRLYTDTTRAVRTAYQDSGFEVVAKNRIPDDHVGYEFEFMAHLCGCTMRALSEGALSDAHELLSAQQRFTQDHLGRWISSFANQVGAAYCADYYAAWAQYAETFAHMDTQLAQECLDCLSTPDTLVGL